MKKIIKLISSLTLVFVLACGMGSNVFAAESSVQYEGNAQEFIFEPGSEESPSDLFTEFKGVMPGDQLNQTIRVKNDGKEDVNVELFVKAEGAVEDEEFLNQMNLKVEADGDKTLFDAPADETAGLTDWVSLGTFKKGADTDLAVTLNVPMTMGNDFQERIGKLNWKFKAAEYPIPVDEEEITKPEQPETEAPAQGEVSKPDTGDRNNIAVPVVIGIAAIAGIAVLIKLKKSKDNE